MTGRFIVFEGGEGSGKSTQAARIADALGALLTRQPGGTTIGVAIRNLLLGTDTVGLTAEAEALLMAADRAQHVGEVIRPVLAADRHVVCDRYVGSSLAYQGGGRELGIDPVAALSEFATGGLRPDLVILLDVPVEVGLTRVDRNGARDRLERQERDFHERVRATYQRLAANHDNWVTVDATGEIAEVADAVDAAVRDTLHLSL